MTAFTINSGSVVNWDTLSGGSVNATLDTYTISSGSTLLIDTDSYQCAGHSTAAGSVDTVSFTGAGGTFKIDGTKVRVIPFTSGSGTVPATGTTISQGGVTSTLLGVWSTWLVEPTAAAAAMPASGFIKVKNKAGGDFSAGALTGISATSSGADVTGWIEVRGADTATITVPRTSSFEISGDWFYLGTATGSAGQVLACPTSATVAGVFPGVQVETASGSGVFEWWKSMGTMVANAAYPTDSFRGKIFWQTTSGIRFGSDGTNAVGAVPPAGAKIRIPNVILTCCTRTASGSGARVLPNATLATRQEFVTTSAGAISVDKGVVTWYNNFSQPYAVAISNSALSDALIVSECATAPSVQDSCVSHTQLQLNTPLQMTSCFSGAEVHRNIFSRVSLAASGAIIGSVSNVYGGNFFDNKFVTSTNKANATTAAVSSSSTRNCKWHNHSSIGARNLHTRCNSPTYTGVISYAETFTGTVSTTYTHSMVEFAACTDVLVDADVSIPVINSNPYGGLISFSGTVGATVRNIGTFSTPLALPGTNGTAVLFVSGGNNADLTFQRVFATGTRTGVHNLVNSDSNVAFDNVWADYADTTAAPQLNSLLRGCGWTPSATGQVSTYGTHWGDFFTSTTAGLVVLFANEPTSATSSQVTIRSGSPKFNSAGQVIPTAIGDQIEFEMPYFAKGHTAFANSAPTITAAANLTVEYQVDLGEGYGGSWKTLNASNLSGEGAIDPAVGFRLKLLVTATGTSILTTVRIVTVTTSVAQSSNLYPLSLATLTLTGLKSGSDVVIRAPGSNTVLSTADNLASTNYSYQYDAGVVTSADVFVHKAGYVPWSIRGVPLSSLGASIPVQQVADRAYL